MLKVKTRRSSLHGGGVASKSSVKSKGFKKAFLSAYVHDSNLITSTPRKQRTVQSQQPPLTQDPQLVRESKDVRGSPRSVHSPQASDEAEPPATTQASVDSSLEDETIFSPGFHHIKPNHGNSEADSTAEVTSGSKPQSLPAHTAIDESAACEQSFTPLSRCSSFPVEEAAPPSQLPEPDAECPKEDWEADGSAEDLDSGDFDPYLFIKRLPKLSEVVSPYRPQLLPKQTRRCPAKTLVLDLDETLVHSTMDICSEADFTFPVDFNHHQHTVYVRVRPYLYEFLDRVSQLFEVIVFTASQSVYAEKLLNILDPNRQRVQHRVFRDSCVFVDGNYLKDLTVLGRDLSKVAIVDNSPQAFGFQVDNGIPIESWFEEKQDRALLDLLPFLESLVGLDDVRPAIAERFKLKTRVDRACLPKKCRT